MKSKASRYANNHLLIIAAQNSQTSLLIYSPSSWWFISQELPDISSSVGRFYGSVIRIE